MPSAVYIIALIIVVVIWVIAYIHDDLNGHNNK